MSVINNCDNCNVQNFALCLASRMTSKDLASGGFVFHFKDKTKLILPVTDGCNKNCDDCVIVKDCPLTVCYKALCSTEIKRIVNKSATQDIVLYFLKNYKKNYIVYLSESWLTDVGYNHYIDWHEELPTAIANHMKNKLFPALMMVKGILDKSRATK
jgi:hypothetical protein